MLRGGRVRRSALIFQVCCMVVLVNGAAKRDIEPYSADDEQFESDLSAAHSQPDYSKFYADSLEAASGKVAKKHKQEAFAFTHSPDFQAFINIPIGGFEDPTAESRTSTKLLPSPKKKIINDPYGDAYDGLEAASEAKDYFEEVDKKIEAQESAILPGPHYVSHEVPADFEYDEEVVLGKAVADQKRSKSKKNKKKVKAIPDYDSFNYDAYDQPEEQQSKTAPLTYFGTKNADYNTGKSSSTVSQYPSASGYVALKLPQPATNKYKYQPDYKGLQSRYLESLASPSAPAVRDGATAQTGTIKNKACRRIEGPENAENMNCFVCEDAPNKAKYTQCSYATNDQPVNQYAGSSIRYSAPVKAPDSFRLKRSPKKDPYDDPYYRVAARNIKYLEDWEKEQEVAESERNRDFHYQPYDPEEYESYSESQSAELLKDPGSCKKVERDGMICTVCFDKKRGNFEQCSYSSAPKEQKYAYVAEKKFDSDDEPAEESKTVTKESTEDPQKASSSAPVPQAIVPTDASFQSATKSQIVEKELPAVDPLTVAASNIDETADDGVETEEDDEDESESKKKEKSDDPNYYGYSDLKKNKQLVSDDPYDVPEHFAASISQEKHASDDDDGYDEYHYKLFPELNNAEETRSEKQVQDASNENQQDVEEVLAEFAKKDRSNCKKAQKNGMTCFLCVDQNKVQHEECMYIAESKPRPSHVAYHEVQRLKDPKGEHQPIELHDHDESKKIEVTHQPAASEVSKRKKFFKKVNPIAVELAAAASGVHKTVVPYEKTRYVKETVKDSRAAASNPDSERLDDDKPKEAVEEPESPKEIEVDDEEGAYSHETKPVYSKQYGTVLPKYMVEKTEYEKDFDAASGFA